MPFIGPNTVLRVSHSGLDANGNPDTIAKAQARLVDGSSIQQGTVQESAWNGDPTDVALGPLLNEVPAATYTLQYRVVDEAGNPSAWTAFGQVTLDGVAPAAPTATLES